RCVGEVQVEHRYRWTIDRIHVHELVLAPHQANQWADPVLFKANDTGGPRVFFYFVSRTVTVEHLSVNVPVLSTHSTVAPPSASIIGLRRTSTFGDGRGQGPSGMSTASTLGNSSGMSAIATVMPASAPPVQSSRNKP